jgi:hypothetical protein
MRRSLAFCAFLLLAAGCGGGRQSGEAQQEPASSEAGGASTDMDASAPSQRSAAGPNVGPTAAPGVAFNYRYAFRLAAERVAEVQEHHARMCEQLGPNRCRITGMHYRFVDEEDIQASLSFKLEPAIARRFGQEGVAAVLRSEGMLVESEISGTDVGTSIRRAGRSIAEMEEDLRRIEARLARGGIPGGERVRLEDEATQLRSSIRAAQETRGEAQESLATTPMTFRYGSGGLVPGIDTRRPIRDALEQAGNNFIEGVAVLFVLFVTLLPWAALALLGWLIYRRVRRRRPAAAVAPEAEAAPES